MKKEDDASKENLDFLRQIAISLEQAEVKLEQAYKIKKSEQFNATKQFILNLNQKISEAVK